MTLPFWKVVQAGGGAFGQIHGYAPPNDGILLSTFERLLKTKCLLKADAGAYDHKLLEAVRGLS